MTLETTGAPLILSAEETDVLRSVLTTALANLHEELYKTEDHDFRTQLQQRTAVLNGILARLPA